LGMAPKIKAATAIAKMVRVIVSLPFHSEARTLSPFK
jgi:hypothetical protein